MSMVSKLMANDEFRSILSSVTGTPESAREDSASASADGEAKEIKEAKEGKETKAEKETKAARTEKETEGQQAENGSHVDVCL